MGEFKYESAATKSRADEKPYGEKWTPIRSA